MAFRDDLKLHLQAGVPALYVESHEWMRFHAAVRHCCEETRKTLHIWNRLEGFKPVPETPDSVQDPMDVVALLNETDLEDRVFLLESFSLEDSDVAASLAVAMRRLRDQRNHVIILTPTLEIPVILQQEFTVLDFPLPNRDEIRLSLKSTGASIGVPEGDIDFASPILDSVRGLGASEIVNAFSKVAAGRKKVTAEEIPLLVAEKEQIIRKSGYLEFIRTESAGQIGGLGSLKEWLELRKNAFGLAAQQAGLNAPKGVLLLGVPGTGKSLSAKVVAREWQMPLLRLDMGRVFGGMVGESESNIRNAIKVAEGLAPCVLWIDEIEKGLSGGSGSSGELDGGTATRVFGSLLTWMQEKTKEVFVFATANDLSRLPPELLRKGRFDEIFFVDLPGSKARKEIFRIHLGSKGQGKVEPTDELVRKTEAFSGAEIEAVVNEALFFAYQPEETPEVTAAHLMEAAENVVPLSSTMGDVITRIRQWAQKRCRKANDPEDTPPNTVSGDQPRLRAEISNPFEDDNGRD